MVSFETISYVVLLLISGLLPVFPRSISEKQEDSIRVVLFVAFMLTASFWGSPYLLQLLSVWPSAMFWYKVKFIGIVGVPVAWLSFALEYTGRKKWVSKRSLTLQSLILVFVLMTI